MLKRILLGVLLLLSAGAVVLAIPVTHHAERSRLIHAPPAAIEAELDDVRDMDHWVPQRRRQPGSSTYDGPARGVGSVWRWKTRDGQQLSLRLTESSPSKVTYEIGAFNPAVQTVTLQPDAAGTRVTWSHAVTLKGFYKLVPLVRSLDSVVGPDLESTLEALAKQVESKQPVAPAEQPGALRPFEPPAGK